MAVTGTGARGETMETPKRFLLFVMGAYYPHGGWRDLRASFDGPAQAFAEGERLTGGLMSNFDCYQVVDTLRWEAVEVGSAFGGPHPPYPDSALARALAEYQAKNPREG